MVGEKYNKELGASATEPATVTLVTHTNQKHDLTNHA